MNALTYPHILRQDVCGRKGQRCEILRRVGDQAQIQFEDGTTLVVNRASLRRAALPDTETKDSKTETQE